MSTQRRARAKWQEGGGLGLQTVFPHRRLYPHPDVLAGHPHPPTHPPRACIARRVVHEPLTPRRPRARLPPGPQRRQRRRRRRRQERAARYLQPRKDRPHASPVHHCGRPMPAQGLPLTWVSRRQYLHLPRRPKRQGVRAAGAHACVSGAQAKAPVGCCPPPLKPSTGVGCTLAALPSTTPGPPPRVPRLIPAFFPRTSAVGGVYGWGCCLAQALACPCVVCLAG
jgi:hypothetical protein